METSANYSRLAPHSKRALSDRAFDSLRAAVKCGEPVCAYVSLPNAQREQVARMALENSTAWLKLSMDMAHMHAWRWDRTLDLFEFAIAEGEDVHLPSMFAGMKRLLRRVHPVDRDGVTRAIDDVLHLQTQVQKEFRLKSKTGRYRWYEAVVRPAFDQGDLPRGLVGVISDITARRAAEMRLCRSEELLRATTANTADTLLLLDSDLMVLFINKALGGKDTAEIIGREIGDSLPPTARSGVTEKLWHLMRTGETATYEFDSFEAGRVRCLENHAVLVRDAGIGTCISISMRDITERKRLEQEILDASSREQQRIGRDLHDGPGQELTGVALMLRGLQGKLGKRCPEAVASINEIVGLVNQSIENTRSLARGLMPVRDERGGLQLALRELASRSRDLYGVDVHFSAKEEALLHFDQAGASHLYRIAQEALTNASRHGHATVVDITLSITPTTFSLHIVDNGEGFSSLTSPYIGIGLKIMRYRAASIGATLEIGPHEPRGTVVRITGERPRAAAESTGAGH